MAADATSPRRAAQRGPRPLRCPDRTEWLDFGCRAIKCCAMPGRRVSVEVEVARGGSSCHAYRVTLASVLFCISCNESCTCTSSTLSRSEAFTAAPAASTTTSAGVSAETRQVSMVQLLAQPEAFHGARVQLVGFVSIEREGTAVYLHKEDFLQGITPNAVWLDLEGALVTLPQKSGYAIVEGRFNPTQRGHMGLFAGGIGQIDRLTPMPSRAEFAAPGRALTFDAGPLPSALPRK